MSKSNQKCTEQCSCDPLTQLLRKSFETIFTLQSDSSASTWALVKSSLESEEKLSDLQYLIVESCVRDFNTKLLMTHGFHEITRSQKQIQKCVSGTGHVFPSVFIDHFNVRESIGNLWRKKALWKYPSLKNCPPPEILINAHLAMDLAKVLSDSLKIEPAKQFSWPKAAAFEVNSRKVAGEAIRWTLNKECYRNCHHVTDTYKVEIGLSEATTGPDDSKVLLSQCILKLLKFLGYTKDNNDEYIVIPASFQIPNVLVSLESIENSDAEENSVIEMEPVEFHTKYSDAVAILYNFARVNSILERYQSLIADVDAKGGDNSYPQIPPVDQVDFSVLLEAKEEVPLIFMLYLWPAVLRSVVNLNRRGSEKINLSFMFDFVKTLAKSFETFYHQVVVIVPKNAMHNFKPMIARIYLLKAIAKVFEEFMDLAGIELEKLPSSSKKSTVESEK